MSAEQPAPEGTVYLLHLVPPYRHARHYLGFAAGGADAVAERLARHRAGGGARLLAVAVAAGCVPVLVRTWPGVTRSFERRLKNTRCVPHYCPACTSAARLARRAAAVEGGAA